MTSNKSLPGTTALATRGRGELGVRRRERERLADCWMWRFLLGVFSLFGLQVDVYVRTDTMTSIQFFHTAAPGPYKPVEWGTGKQKEHIDVAVPRNPTWRYRWASFVLFICEHVQTWFETRRSQMSACMIMRGINLESERIISWIHCCR